MTTIGEFFKFHEHVTGPQNTLRVKEQVIRCLKQHGGRATTPQILAWFRVMFPEREFQADRGRGGVRHALEAVAKKKRLPHNGRIGHPGFLWTLKREYSR